MEKHYVGMCTNGSSALMSAGTRPGPCLRNGMRLQAARLIFARPRAVGFAPHGYHGQLRMPDCRQFEMRLKHVLDRRRVRQR
jgi:hypothetical protein